MLPHKQTGKNVIPSLDFFKLFHKTQMLLPLYQTYYFLVFKTHIHYLPDKSYILTIYACIKNKNCSSTVSFRENKLSYNPKRVSSKSLPLEPIACVS